MSSTASAPRVGGERRTSVMSNVARGSLGNLIEWFDFYNYAIFTTYIASNFFAKGDETQALLDTWAVFAITFLMRPIGSWFFGRYADRKGGYTRLVRAGFRRGDAADIAILELVDRPEAAPAPEAKPEEKKAE